MSTNFPTTLDAAPTDPVATDARNSPSLATQQAFHNKAVVALETKVGVDSSAVTSTLDYKLTNTAQSNPGHKHTLANGATDVAASEADLDACTNFEQTISSTTSKVTITDGSIDFDVASHDGTNGLKLGGTLVTSSAVELNKVDGMSGTAVGTTDTQTLTNKRITKRITTIVSNATPTVNTDNCEAVTITALATFLTLLQLVFASNHIHPPVFNAVNIFCAIYTSSDTAIQPQILSTVSYKKPTVKSLLAVVVVGNAVPLGSKAAPQVIALPVPSSNIL